MTRCPSVSLSVCHNSESVFDTEASCDQCSEGIRVAPKILIPCSQTLNFRIAPWPVDRSNALLSQIRNVDAQCDKLATDAKFAILATVDVRPTTLGSLSRWTPIHICGKHDVCEAARRAGLSATAGIRNFHDNRMNNCCDRLPSRFFKINPAEPNIRLIFGLAVFCRDL